VAALNGLLASPTFGMWREGATLDLESRSQIGRRPRVGQPPFSGPVDQWAGSASTEPRRLGPVGWGPAGWGPAGLGPRSGSNSPVQP
jgi:hypothetical protein